MKWILPVAALFFEACALPRWTVNNAVPEFPEAYQALRTVDAKGPSGEDSVVTVTFRSSDGHLFKLRAKWPIETHALEMRLTYVSKPAHARRHEESLTLPSEIEAAFVDAMERRVAAILHLDPRNAAGLQSACYRAGFGSSDHALLIMLIEMQRHGRQMKGTPG